MKSTHVWENWQRQPVGCTLPVFDARKFLLHLQGKHMLLAGDSITRNMYDSLICLLTAHPDIHAERVPDFYSTFFPAYRATIDYKSSPYFTQHVQPSELGK